MKIKTWLLLSYLIVMILPLVAAYLLFAWISSYDDDQKVNEHLKTMIELQDVKPVLNNPELYDGDVDEGELEELTNHQRFITLYDSNGFVLYTSNQAISTTQSNINYENLYQDLYTLEQGYRTQQYKEPVFDNGDLVGFFEIEVARDEWVGAVSNRTIWTLSVFIALFIMIYLIVVGFVNRKLNRRLTGLMDEMTAFARGETLKGSETNKDEIGALKRHFYTMRDQINDARTVIEQEQQEKEYMVASISHDLKTPLTSIKAYAESLDVDHVLTEQEQAEYRRVIIEKSDFMKQMLDDLLMYTLLKSPTYEIERVEVDGSEFFDMLVSGYEPLCKEKKIRLLMHTQVTGLYHVNPKQMMRVTDNVMSNAIKHTPVGGTIWIGAFSEKGSEPDWLYDFINLAFDFDQYAYLIVQNEGNGINQEKLQQIFDPLYQADQARSKRDDHGTGLGLSIAKQIMNKHHGDVLIQSQEKTGTCVICRLPVLNKGGEEYEHE